MNKNDLTKDQNSALATLWDWYHSKQRSPYIILGGLAGTGKTTIISMFRNMLPKDLSVAFVAYTGKAASVLKSKLAVQSKNALYQDFCGTIHSMMYEPITDENNSVIDWRKIAKQNFDLIIIDECSMVTKDIFEDILSYEIPVICVGDHGQLPPIESNGFNLMNNPDIKLETIHRFGENSELLKVSMMARLEGKIRYGDYGNQVFKVTVRDSRIKDFLKSCDTFDTSMVLCGFNKTRIKMNAKIRAMLQRVDNDPIVGDRVVCLKNNKNSHGCPIYNGMTGTIETLRSFKNCHDVKIKMDGEDTCYKGVISKNAFMREKYDGTEEFIYRKDLEMFRKIKSIGDYYGINNAVKEKNTKVFLDTFDYSYCMTVHKSQGSEYKKVLLIEEGKHIWDKDGMWNRWLYTAVTRAKEQLMIIS